MRSTLLAGALLAFAAATSAHAQAIKLADVAELSGGGATVGTNWKNGIDLAIEEINAKGGVLGRKLEVTHADSQSNPGVARAQVQKALDAEPYVLLGPGYSGSVKVTAPLAAEAGITQIMGGEAAELTQAGNKFLFRTSFGQQSSMPKVAKYIHDEMKAKSVAVVWVNNDFGRGGRDVVVKELDQDRMRRSGLVVPPGTHDPPPQQGIVLAVGPGLDWWEQAGVEMPVQPGDHVVFPASAGVWVEVDEERLLVCRVVEILGILESATPEPDEA